MKELSDVIPYLLRRFYVVAEMGDGYDGSTSVIHQSKDENDTELIIFITNEDNEIRFNISVGSDDKLLTSEDVSELDKDSRVDTYVDFIKSNITDEYIGFFSGISPLEDEVMVKTFEQVDIPNEYITPSGTKYYFYKRYDEVIVEKNLSGLSAVFTISGEEDTLFVGGDYMDVGHLDILNEGKRKLLREYTSDGYGYVMSPAKNVVLYHHPCLDGTTAALVHKYITSGSGVTYDYVHVNYSTNISLNWEELETLTLLDYTPSEDKLRDLLSKSIEYDFKVIIVDHHKTAYESIRRIILDVGANEDFRKRTFIRIDMSESGGSLASKIDFRSISYGNTVSMDDRYGTIDVGHVLGGYSDRLVTLKENVNASEFIELMRVRDLFDLSCMYTNKLANTLSSALMYEGYTNINVTREDPRCLMTISSKLDELLSRGVNYETVVRAEAKRNAKYAPVYETDSGFKLGIQFNMSFISDSGFEFSNVLYGGVKGAVYIGINVDTRNERLGFSFRSDDGESALKYLNMLIDAGVLDSGGGHPNACGASSKVLYGKPLNEVVESIIKCELV